MNHHNILLVVGIIILIVAIGYLTLNLNRENFESPEEHSVENPEHILQGTVKLMSQRTPENEEGSFEDDGYLNDYVRKTDIERAARASAREYCPVGPDYNPSDFVKKTEIDFQKQCPKMPDLKDYVLKSTIPPVQKCPSCVCPKVKVTAGMCKKCPEPKNNCPKPQPCGFEQCKDVIKCGPGDKPYSCPKCPAPKPCPEPIEKVCPALELPKLDFKCPPPKPCPMPGPCPNSEGRCPEADPAKCRYYGVKDVVRDKNVDEIVNELMESNDPKLMSVLENLKAKLNNPYKTNPQVEAAPTTSSTNLEIENEVNVKELPEQIYNNDTQYSLNDYSYSIYNDGMYTNPKPSVVSNIANEPLNPNNNLNRQCDLNDTNCPYNTNINM